MRVDTIDPHQFPERKFTYFDIAGIDNQTNRIVETKTIAGRNAPSRARQAVRKNDILFSTVRTYLKNIAMLDRAYPNPVASTGFAVIRVPAVLSSQFIFFQVLSDDFLRRLNRLQSGTSYPSVRSKDVFAQPILVAPKPEQTRIVETLNESMSRFARGATAARRALNRIERYRTAVLHAAVTGELTSSWRKVHKPKQRGEQLLQQLLKARRAGWEHAELLRLSASRKKPKSDTWKARYPEPTPLITQNLPALPSGWTWASVDQLSVVVRGSSPRPAGDPRYFGGRIPWITVGTITKDSEPYLTEVTQTLTQAGKKLSRFIEKGTLLLSNSGATLGVPKISDIAGCINDGVAALLHVESRLTLYLYYFLAYQTEHLRRINRGAAQPNLNIDIIRRIVVPIPPFAEQSRINREIEKRLTAADRLSTTLGRQVEQSHVAYQSLMRAAFEGRLVAQDPNDEPASLLIEQVRLLREFESKKQRKRRMTTPKSKMGRKPLLDVLRAHKKPITPEELFVEAGFRPAEADLFYRELTSLRKIIKENKPSGSAAKRWPLRARVLLQLKDR